MAGASGPMGVASATAAPVMQRASDGGRDDDQQPKETLMERTRVIVNVGVVFDVNTYASAGEVLDQIDGKLGKVLAKVDGKHEITGFQTRPCKAARFDRVISERAYTDDDQAEMPQPMQGVSPDRF
jgi:hypothetical protein